MNPSSIPDLLTDTQVHALCSIQQGLKKAAELAQRINTLTADHSLHLPSLILTAHETGRLWHAVETVLIAHDIAMGKLRRAAGASPERYAA
ncbi:MAG TPA: hypothetical protein VMV48_06040 [Gallionellaceae bacterium]|nr:hypothetical protein [Gallionellaceae bacterium]